MNHGFKSGLRSWAAVGCVFALLVSSCSESSGPATTRTPPGLLADSPHEPTTQPNSEDSDPSLTGSALSLEELARLFLLSRDQVDLYETYRFHSEIHIDGTDQRDALITDGVVNLPASTSHIRFSGPDSAWEQIVIGARRWSNDGTDWVEVDPGDPSAPPSLGPFVSYPTAWEAAGSLLQGEVTVVGTKEIQGRHTLHVRAEPRTSIDFEGDKPSGDLWIDEEGILIKGRWAAISPTDPGSREPGSVVEWTWDLLDLGWPAIIEPPRKPPVAEVAAQETLRVAMTVAKVYFVDSESYNATPADLARIEPAIDYTDNLATITADNVGFVATPTRILMIATNNKDWFCITDDVTWGLGFGTGDTLDDIDSFDECRNPAW